MKVLIDATPLLLHSAGVKGHLFQWIRAMRGVSAPGVIRTWPALRGLAELNHTRSLASRWETWIGVGAFLASYKLDWPSYDFVLPRADLFHACIMQTRVPRRRRITATVYDMTPLLMPEHHMAENVQSFTAHAQNVLRHAHALTAISEHSRMDAIRLLGIAPDRIVTIPCIIDAPYTSVTEADADAARQSLSLRKPFVLAVGTVEPRKNLDRLLDAWLQMKPAYREEFELLVVGSAGWHSEATVARLQSGLPGVRWLGYVPEARMPGLSKAAALLAYPSLYEGFGLPPAQALAAGTAVLASRVSSLPEVVGPGGILVDPQSPAEIAAGLARLLDDAELRASYGAQGRQHILEHFNAEKVGRASLRFFEAACG